MTSDDFAAAQRRVVVRQQRHQTISQESASTKPQPSAGRHAYIGVPGVGRLIETWTRLNTREGTRPPFRVGQLDSELLDEELLVLLKGQVGEGLKFFGVCCGCKSWLTFY